jgi:oxygen-independent coproporphyrinogen-3 oxidase
MSQNPEFTMEAEPVTITKSKADTMLSLKVNRMSMGVQSFDDEIIQASHRLDSEKKALKAIDLVLQTGVPLNIDLMSGLAGDTPEKWQHSVQRHHRDRRGSVTVYETELYSNTEYYRGVRNQTLELPSDEDEMASMRYSLRELINADYVPGAFSVHQTRGQPACPFSQYLSGRRLRCVWRLCLWPLRRFGSTKTPTTKKSISRWPRP